MKCSSTLLVLLLSVVISSALAQDSFEDTGARFVLKLYNDCSRTSTGMSPCLKKKAYTFLDRLSRMEKFNLTEGVTVTKAADAPATEATPVVTEEALEKTLPRSADAQDAVLNNMLIEKVSSFVSSRSISVALPRVSAEDFEDIDEDEAGRKIGGGGGKKKKGGKKGMMGGMMMLLAAKMAALIPIKLAGLFLLAKKALIIAKIALLLSGIILIKKLFAAKQGGGHGGGGHGGSGWQSSGSSGHGGGWDSGSSSGGGGWQSSGGGWDKRSMDAAQDLAYNAYRSQ